MDNNLFQNNPAFNNLSPEKLAFLMNFANAKKPTQLQEMMPFLMSSMNQAKKENIQFTPSESDLLIDIFKKNLSPEEARKVDLMMRIMKNNPSQTQKK
ncbi:MAG: hypothetical protein IKB01_14145 [Lachnospiraceae bacterium]|nr:hypothetical protein [Lachnospiraceae bacterium]